jgi:hypothetical protein
MNLRKDEIADVVAGALPEIRELALVEMQRRIDKHDLKLSDELYKSFKAAVLKAAGDMQQEIVLSFNFYGRYKDLRYVQYDGYNMPNNVGKKYTNGGSGDGEMPALVQGMKDMILKNGGMNGRYVPGYTSNGSHRMPITTRAIDRLAWTLAISRLKKGKITNRKKGWYNEARGAIVLKASGVLMKRIRAVAMDAIAAKAMGKEIKFNV